MGKAQAYPQGEGRIGQAIATFGTDHRMIWCNAAFARLYRAHGAAPDLAQVLDGSLFGAVPEAMGGGLYRLPELELQLDDMGGAGTIVTCRQIRPPAQDPGALQRLIETRTRQLIASEERLRIIANEVPAGIAHIDEDLTILYANRRFARAYGLTPETMIGRNTRDVLHCNTMEQSARFFEQARRGMVVDFEMRVELPGARFKDVRTLLRPARPSSGEVIGFYLVSIDVTRRKETMNALMRSQKMDALGRMASGISHDFNNLLTIILGNLVPLSEQLGQSPLREEFLRPAISAARRGSDLTRRLVSLARREELDPLATDIGEATQEICALLRSSIPSTLTLELLHDPVLPAALVDRSQLEMALLNLALNARDATGGRGTIRICLSAHDLPAEEAEVSRIPAGRYLRILFEDDGCGIRPEILERIFEPFFTSKQGGAGSGLGLSMVYGFVQQSNGTIHVDSRPGIGTSFTILLPSVDLSPAPPRARPAPLPARPPFPPAAQTAPPRHGVTLIVEDDADLRHLLCRRLAHAGHAVIDAASSQEALALIGQIEDIRAVISDIDMPGTMTGLDLAVHLRRHRPDLPVTLMSGKPKPLQPWPEHVGFVQKPFDPAILLDRLPSPWPLESDAAP
ncbi:ATP-binding protein [Thioclava sp. GXIMD4216]|uniref:ATP-binding protein n=1 Tax=Thioclava sp. GXIMD4216 TaxID=3131929 RepID=UPI0030CCD7EE